MKTSPWALAIVLLAVPAAATTMLRLDLAALVRTSDVVARGRVRFVESKWTEDRMRIVTEVQVEIAERWKGMPSSAITVVQPGGRVGDIGQRVDGIAAFQPDEDVVLFLERRPGDAYVVTGMAQGKWRVERSSDGSATFAIPSDVGDARLIDPGSRETVDAQARPMKLEELRKAVGALVGTAPVQEPPPPTQTLPVKKVP